MLEAFINLWQIAEIFLPLLKRKERGGNVYNIHTMNVIVWNNV